MADTTLAPDRAYTFVWQIKNFSYISKNKKTAIKSPMFKSNSGSWMVEIRIGSEIECAESIGVSLGNEELNQYESGVYDWEYSFLDANGTSLFTKAGPNYNFHCEFDDVDNFNWSDSTGPTLQEVLTERRTEFLPDDTLTLRLHFWQSEEEHSEEGESGDAEYCSTTTVMELDRLCFLWNIEEFSSFDLNTQITKSFYFIINETTCTFTFSIQGTFLESSWVNLEVSSDAIMSWEVLCRISVLDTKKEYVKTQEELYCFDVQQKWFLPPLSTRQMILENREQYLHEDDVLSLVLEFETVVIPYLGTTYFNLADLESIPETAEITLFEADTVNDANVLQQNDNIATIFANDILTLYHKRTLCDFELRCKGSSFPVHKMVLCARSPFFKNIFSSVSEETGLDFYHDPDLDSKTANMMLTIMYGGTLKPDLSWENARRLYAAAVKYQIQSLKKDCSSILKSGISVLNACDFLVLVAKCCDDELKSFVENFLLENIKEVADSPQWKKFLDQNMLLGFKTMAKIIGRSPRKKPRVSFSPPREEAKPSSSSQSAERT